MSKAIYLLECPEGQKSRRVRLVRAGDLPHFVCVRDGQTGELMVVTENRLRRIHESEPGNDCSAHGGGQPAALGVCDGARAQTASRGAVESAGVAVLAAANGAGHPGSAGKE